MNPNLGQTSSVHLHEMERSVPLQSLLQSAATRCPVLYPSTNATMPYPDAEK